MKKHLLVFLLGVTMARGAVARLPVILDTDIATDIDDSWAIALLLRSPELDLKLVVTDSGDTRYRAQAAAKFLEAAGRGDIPVGIGIDRLPMAEDTKNLAGWVDGYDLAKYPGGVRADGVAALIDAVMKSPEPVTIIAIGPVPNLAEALKREPRLAEKCRLVGMYGSVDRGYGDSPTPSAEYNVKADVPSLRAVLAAPWREILLTPLDTCGLVQLDGARYHEIWSATGDPLLRALITSYCLFADRVKWMKCDFFATRSTTLFDCVAVYLAYSTELVEVEDVRFDVTADGFTKRDPHGPFHAKFALKWKDLEAFEQQLATRVLGK